MALNQNLVQEMLREHPINNSVSVPHIESLYNLKSKGNDYKIVSTILSNRDQFMEISFKSIIENNYSI